MKTIKKSLLVLAVFIIMTHPAFSQTTTLVGPTDVEKYADAIAGLRVSYWKGTLSFTGVTNNIMTPVTSSYVIQLINGRWAFTEMSINGEELPIDPAHPLWEIPPYLAGAVQNFQFNMQGYDKSGQAVRYGYYNTDALAPNASISVTIYLNYVLKKVPYALTGDETSSTVAIISADGKYNGWYDPNSGTFYVYYDPVNPPSTWLVIDTRNNSVIQPIPFTSGLGGAPVVNSGNGLSLVNYGNIPELNMSTSSGSYMSLRGLPTDHTVIRDGASYTGKFIDVHVSLPSDYVVAFFSNLKSGSTVQVSGLNPQTGEMEHVSDWTVGSGQNYVNIFNVTGYADYKFVVIGTSADPTSGFNLDIYDSVSPWNTGGKG